MRACGLAAWAVLLLSVVPLVVGAWVALSPGGVLGASQPLGLTWDNFRVAMLRGQPLRCLANSALVGLLSAGLGVLFGIPAAYLLSRHPWPKKGLVLGALVLLRLNPKVVSLAAQYQLVHALGVGDTHLAVALVRGGGIVVATWLIKASMDAVPVSLERAASLDGLRPAAILVRIVVPLALPGIVSAFLVEFASAWNSFLLALLFLTSEEHMTVPLGIDRFLSGYGMEPGPLAAFTLLVSLPMAVVWAPTVLLVMRTLQGQPSRRQGHCGAQW